MSAPSKAGKLHPVNTRMTNAMIAALNKRDKNRSRFVRLILAAILQAHQNGDSGPFDQAIAAAQRSSSRTRKMTQAPDAGWKKAIVWIPEKMHHQIATLVRGYGLRPADFIRGSVIGFTGIDPVQDIVREGHELWASDVVEENGAEENG